MTNPVVQVGDSETLDGPYFDDLTIGQRFDTAPALTLTEGRAALHQAILGDRLRLALDAQLSQRVTGGALAHPALVWNVAIGQSTVATRHVKANLFYRGLTFRRAPSIGDTLTTTTTVVALRQNQRKPGRAATGLAALYIVTDDQHRRRVLDFYRCAMIPLRDGDRDTGHADDLATVGADSVVGADAIEGWSLDAAAEALPGPRFHELVPGMRWDIVGADVVTSAPELARLTLNIAEVHHDSVVAGGRRLVYGGHTIGLALAQVSRALPAMVTVLAWQSCEHTGPVYEGDTLRSKLTVGHLARLPGGGGTAQLRTVVHADGSDGPRPVLDWRFTAVLV
ncbi:acyl dehydratase [Nocardia sp. NPDC050175]|uniref:acyl dehydratase n=1 Tax=Nocardia sp. NPDC050175 TaxID=3364317 RepID=UPI0037A18945